MVEQVKRLSAALPDDLSEASVEAVEDVLRATYDALTVEAPCTTCGGTRKVRKPSELGPGMHVNTVSWVPCPDCSTCPTCGSHDRQFVFEACDPENGGVTQDPWHTQGGVS